MSRTISIHSFRRGTGKSMVIANMAATMALDGQRVGVVDTGFRSPSAHILFGLDEREIHHVVNDFVWGRCDIEQAAYDLTEQLQITGGGRLFLAPASTDASEIARIARVGYDVGLLNEGIRALVETLHLDALMLDTHAGINEETLLSIALCDVMGLLVRIDKQDHQGSAVIIDLARKLGVPEIKLIINEVPTAYDVAALKEETEKTYQVEVVAIIPHSEEIMALSSAGLLVLRQPDHPLTRLFQQVVGQFQE